MARCDDVSQHSHGKAARNLHLPACMEYVMCNCTKGQIGASSACMSVTHPTLFAKSLASSADAIAPSVPFNISAYLRTYYHEDNMSIYSSHFVCKFACPLSRRNGTISSKAPSVLASDQEKMVIGSSLTPLCLQSLWPPQQMRWHHQ